MKVISIETHGIIDYLYGIFLIASSGLLDYYRCGMETWTAIAFGGLSILTALLTDYPMGLFRVISRHLHLSLDLFAGISLAVSPWVLGFHQSVYMPHLLFGIFAIILWMTTKIGSLNQEDTADDNIRSTGTRRRAE